MKRFRVVESSETDAIELQNKLQNDAVSALKGKKYNAEVAFKDEDLHVNEGLMCVKVSSSEKIIKDELSEILNNKGLYIVTYSEGVSEEDEELNTATIVVSDNNKYSQFKFNDKDLAKGITTNNSLNQDSKSSNIENKSEDKSEEKNKQESEKESEDKTEKELEEEDNHSKEDKSEDDEEDENEDKESEKEDSEDKKKELEERNFNFKSSLKEAKGLKLSKRLNNFKINESNKDNKSMNKLDWKNISLNEDYEESFYKSLKERDTTSVKLNRWSLGDSYKKPFDKFLENVIPVDRHNDTNKFIENLNLKGSEKKITESIRGNTRQFVQNIADYIDEFMDDEQDWLDMETNILELKKYTRYNNISEAIKEYIEGGRFDIYYNDVRDALNKLYENTPEEARRWEKYPNDKLWERYISVLTMYIPKAFKLRMGREFGKNKELNESNSRVREAKVYYDLTDGTYKPWSGAIETWEAIEDAGKLDELDRYIDEIYPEGIGETELNDLLWHDGDTVLTDLGILPDTSEEEDFDESIQKVNEGRVKDIFTNKTEAFIDDMVHAGLPNGDLQGIVEIFALEHGLNDDMLLDIIRDRQRELNESKIREARPVKGRLATDEELIKKYAGIDYLDKYSSYNDRKVYIDKLSYGRANYQIWLNPRAYEGIWHTFGDSEKRDIERDYNKAKDNLKKEGAKYFTISGRGLKFYLDDSILNKWREEDANNRESDYQSRLSSWQDKISKVDIDKYKPSQQVLDKIKAYRDKGSKVNVKAIKDKDKLYTYYYAACILDWSELENEISSKINSHLFDEDPELEAIRGRVEADANLGDTRTNIEKNKDLPSSNGLFTFESKSCWLPKSILKFFIDNKIPVNFKKRTSGAEYDTNGCQWSEVEHLVLYPGTDKERNIDIVVHTNEGNTPTTYSYKYCRRTSAKKVIKAISKDLGVSLNESKIQESYMSRYTDTEDQEFAVKKIERAANKVGMNISYGTSVGRFPQRMILDYEYQDGKISIYPNGALRIGNIEIGDREDLYFDINEVPSKKIQSALLKLKDKEINESKMKEKYWKNPDNPQAKAEKDWWLNQVKVENNNRWEKDMWSNTDAMKHLKNFGRIYVDPVNDKPIDPIYVSNLIDEWGDK